jgi:hypothetical protein
MVMRHLMVDEEQHARDILKQIRSGADFVEWSNPLPESRQGAGRLSRIVAQG